MRPATRRAAASFSREELALLDQPSADGLDVGAVLTPDGWVVAAPLAETVDAVRREATGPMTDQDALQTMLKARGRETGRSAASRQELGKFKTRLSRQRAATKTASPIAKKVPPKKRTP